MSSPGRDVKLSLDRVKGYRNFITKIWNTFSYCEINNVFKLNKIELANIKIPANQWIIATLNLYKQKIIKNINDYRFDEAAKNIYLYIWNYFCDWYIEFSKPLLNSKNNQIIKETKNILLYVQRENLSILHAFIPFVTEELWTLTKFRKMEKTDLINFNFKKDHKLKNFKGVKDIDYIINFITDLRSIKAKLNISPGNFVDLNIKELPKKNQKIIYNNELIIKKLGRIKNFNLKGVKSKIAKVILANNKISIFFGDDIDLDHQISILNKKVEVLQSQINNSENKLKNDNFIKKAPKNIINQEKNLLENNKNEYKNLSEIINSLK